jgi:hypothetical protein
MSTDKAQPDCRTWSWGFSPLPRTETTTPKHTADDERWLPAPGWEDRYRVSDHGRVANMTGHVLSLQPQHSGHLRAVLWRDNRPHSLFVHRLVLIAFVSACPDGMEACHGDGDPTNNRLTNLRWDTRSANLLDSVQHGTHAWSRREKCPAGHPYDETNTYLNPAGGRVCRECRRESARRNYDPAKRLERFKRARDAK